MRFYNLTFDCNTPTKQQVNIPTNTDYKVGIKVVRNGKQSILSTEEVNLGTLSADADKTNGYVTFTESAGDTPSMTEKDVIINKGYDYDDTTKTTGYSTTNTGVNFDLSCTAESLGVAGQELSLDSDVQWGSTKSSSSPVDVENIASWMTPKTLSMGQWVMWNWPNGQAAVAFGNTSMPGGGKIYHFYTWDENGNYIGDGIPTIIQPTWILRAGANGLRAQNNYYVIAYKMKFGTPYSAKFKLVENVYKSQQGDIDDGGSGSGGSINISGEYSDGTNFSFDALTK